MKRGGEGRVGLGVRRGGGGIIDREIRWDYFVLVILVKPSSIFAFIFFLIPNLFSNDLSSLVSLCPPLCTHRRTYTHTYTANGFKRLRDFVFSDTTELHRERHNL